MKFSNADGSAERVTFDMTPMIDCTFQLVIFFLLTLNFSMDDQAEFIRLPASDLAKPPPPSNEARVTLQVTDKGMAMLGGDLVPVEALRPLVLREAAALKQQGKTTASATVIIRADAQAPTGKVQEVIKTCQEAGFEKFVLRAKEDLGKT